MVERKNTSPGIIEQMKAILPNFIEAYIYKEPVIGAGIGIDFSKRGRERLVFQAYLKDNPTEEQQRSLRKTFRGVPIRYEVVGPVVAGFTPRV